MTVSFGGIRMDVAFLNRRVNEVLRDTSRDFRSHTAQAFCPRCNARRTRSELSQRTVIRPLCKLDIFLDLSELIKKRGDLIV